MRLYCFSHFMLSPMAKGIQALHSTVEMFNKYNLHQEKSTLSLEEAEKCDMAYEWSLYHKTCIVLNGGVSSDLNALELVLNDIENPYPWAPFYEDESLGNLLTSLSIVLPEHMYETANLMRKYSRDIYFFEDSLYCENKMKLEQDDLDMFIKINSSNKFSTWEQDFMPILISARLAS